MRKEEVDYWLSELETEYRAAGMSERYRCSQIHEAIRQAIKDRKRSKDDVLRDYYLKLYFIMMIMVVISRLFWR